MMAGKLQGLLTGDSEMEGEMQMRVVCLETPLGEFGSDTLGTGLSGLSGLWNLAVEVRSQTREAHFNIPSSRPLTSWIPGNPVLP